MLEIKSQQGSKKGVDNKGDDLSAELREKGADSECEATSEGHMDLPVLRYLHVVDMFVSPGVT